MTMINEISVLLNNLTLSDDRFAVLNELKTILIAVHPSVLKDIIPNINFQCIFECINPTDDTDQIEVTCEILKKLLGAVSSTTVLHNFHTELLGGLQHPANPVKILCLDVLKRVVKESPDELIADLEVCTQTTKLLCADSLEVAKEAASILAQLGVSDQGLERLYSGEVFALLQEILVKNDIARYRVFQLVVDVCQLSPVALNLGFQSGLLTHLLNDLHKDDILLQLSCLSMLTDIALTEHGLLFLSENGVIDRLAGMLESITDSPLGSFLIPGFVKFFGNIAHFRPLEVFERYPTFILQVLKQLDSTEDGVRSVAIETVGFVGESVAGKRALEKLGSEMDKAVTQIGSLIQNLAEQMKCKVLKSLVSLINLQPTDQTEDMLHLTEHWFNKLSNKPFHMLMRIAEQPFAELRCTTFQIFQAMAKQDWGQKIMNSYPGFNEYLLDRSTANNKEEKDGKFEIVRSLVDMPMSAENFGRPYLVKLKEYYTQGPYYLRAQAEVAIEGSS